MVTQEQAAQERTAQELIQAYIYFSPNRPGLDEAKVSPHGVSVWAIIGYLSGPGGNIEETAHDYDIPVDAVRAALAYYERHREVIDNRSLANEWPNEVIYGEFPPRPERVVPDWRRP